ncbi:MAG: tRNA (adenosine(37)-N6)-threonylcarbamoyltransferase complex transferase subunit TsaD [Candidatus Saelkia tenebricola]|nr:tRNA (adenosine(37)-N6)-threonylcarbamoyltransferase complex transferase subunit TsaD [Candidatus Saelkia tenebricola]
MKVLGIETSCDETSVAVVENGKTVLANVIASSLDIHKQYGGIVPEIATRHHVEVILPVLEEAIKTSQTSLSEIDLISVTQGPGLIGSLMIGIIFAKSLSFALKKPIIAVDHILSHLYAACLSNNNIEFPSLGLVVSGGHTSLFLLNSFTDFKVIGKTRDDALGEAYDKVAKILNLGFPGGPVIERKANSAKNKELHFTAPSVKSGYDFSYSGLKTAVLYYTRKLEILDKTKTDEICYAFQEAALTTLLKQVKKTVLDYGINRMIVGGGVIANKNLRRKLSDSGLNIYLPEMKYCSDNAGMVAGLGYELYNKKLGTKINFEPYSTFEEKWEKT